jgi:hypothetical protein
MFIVYSPGISAFTLTAVSWSMNLEEKKHGMHQQFESIRSATATMALMQINGRRIFHR